MTTALATEWLTPINEAAADYSINTAVRMAAWLAQCSHESGGFRVTVENLNYGAAGLLNTWPSRFTKETAEEYARSPEKIANHVYSNRMGNGDEASGDGWKYRGRGLIQLSGKSNYEAFGTSAGIDAVGDPDQVASATYAARSAGWYWQEHGLNALADKNTLKDFREITQTINGGQTGAADREAKWTAAKTALGA